MRKILVLFCLSICCLPALAQSGKDNNVPLFFEKAYLHTDRDVYGQGEDVWYKAYIVNAPDNIPINYSHNLYVELINPEAKIVIRNTLRLDNGTGNGDFQLSDSIPAGKYRLRAYTNWMRNFGDNFIFEKQLTILNTGVDSKVAASPKTITKNKTASATASATSFHAPTAPAVRFFPEGGSLVEGISSIVGIKAEDANGKGIMAKGAVISSASDTVGHFSCDSLGMGLLVLLPVKGLTYRALVNLNGGVRKQVGNYPAQPNQLMFTLPPALSTGLVLQVKQTDSVIHAVISSSDPLISNTIALVVKHGGKTQLYKQLQLQQLQTAVKIATATLPEGISAITIYDSQGKPNCERLVYIHHPGNKNSLTITTDKKSYQPKGQVSVSIHTQPNARLSMAVLNASTVPVPTESILSYLNLQSEVRGNIEKPNRYFDTTNVNRFKQLDLLLMTQGWRDFVWRRIADTTIKLTHEPEPGIAITGNVRGVTSKKPLPGIYISMHAPKAVGNKFFDAVTDSAGKFGIYGLKFYGYQYLNLSARNYSRKAKSNTGGWLQVDSLKRDTLPVYPGKPFTPFDSLSLTDPLLTLNIPKSHQLKEVQIRGTNKYGIPPENRTISLAEHKDYGNVLQYLLYTIPEAHTGGGACGIILMDNNAPRYQLPIGIGGSYVDNSPMERSTCPSDFFQLPMSNVLKLTIHRWYDMDFRLRLSVSLVLRPGSLRTKDFFDDTMADMVGYNYARTFYKANYEDQNSKPDPRVNTIFWEPNIITDNEGNATVNYYNNPQKGNIRLIVQGITDKGLPLVSTTKYEVK